MQDSICVACVNNCMGQFDGQISLCICWTAGKRIAEQEQQPKRFQLFLSAAFQIAFTHAERRQYIQPPFLKSKRAELQKRG